MTKPDKNIFVFVCVCIAEKKRGKIDAWHAAALVCTMAQ